MAVKDYNTDPDLNVTISGINIAEGCPPSGINNAIRQLMADVKAEQGVQAAKDEEQDAKIAGKFDKSGGTLTGSITKNGALAYCSGTGNELGLRGGPEYKQGGDITMCGIGHPTESVRGGVLLRGFDSSGASTGLLVKSDGVTINGSSILTTAGGLIKGTLKLDSGNSLLAQRTVDDGVLVLRGGTDGTSASIQISGKNHSSLPGWVAIFANDGTNTNTFTVQPNGIGTLNGKTIITLGNMDYVLPDYSAGVTVSSGFTAPRAGLYRHSSINVTGNTYVNGVLVDNYAWEEGSWAGHAGCTLLLSKGDVITYTGTAPANRKFFPLKGA